MKKKQILIVEDERIVAHDIQMGLRRLGYTVSGIAVSGEEAIKKTEEAQPDLVLVDIVLEGNIDGIKAAEIIRSRFNIPIVYLTAYADKSTIERVKKTEPFGYIVKPFEDRELNSIIEIALYRHKIGNMMRESEEKYRELADSISDVFFAMDKDLRYTYWNKASEKLTGIKAKDALGKSIIEIFPDNEETRRAKKAYQEVLQTKKSQTFINEYSLAGKQYFFEISAYPSKRGLSVFVRDITARKKTEEALKASEAFNFALFQYNPVETIVVDREGRVAKTNLARRKSGDRLPNIRDIMYKDFAGKHEINMHAELMECIRSGKKKNFPELKYGNKFLSITIAPFPKGAIITSQNITERKRFEQALRESEATAKALLNAPTDSVFMTDASGVVLALNETAARRFGGYPNEFIGKCGYDLIPSHTAKSRKAKIDQVFSSGKPSRFEDEREGIWFDTVIYPVFDEGGKVTKVATVARDISERHQAEESLKESEKRYKQLFEGLNDGVIVFSSKGKFLDCNQITLQLFGYQKKELLCLEPTDIIHPDFHDLMRDNQKRIWAGESTTVESAHICKNGRIIPVEVTARRIEYKEGSAILAVIRDITERKKTEEELEKSRVKLRNLAAHLQSIREEERTSIAREMHDELGQSLTALKMDLALLGHKLPKNQRSLINKMKSMSKLVDTTLKTVKRISTYLRPRLLDDLGLAAAIEWQAEEFQNRTGTKCEVTLDPPDLILDQDCSTAIFRIFQETLTNIARHAHATRADVRLIKKPGRIELRVKDNGKGVTEEQIRNPKSFGLIGMQERASFLGGEVKIRGVQGKGTTVTAKIPPSKEGVLR